MMTQHTEQKGAAKHNPTLMCESSSLLTAAGNTMMNFNMFKGGFSPLSARWRFAIAAVLNHSRVLILDM